MSEEIQREIEDAILRALYAGWAERGDVSLNTILEEGKWDESLFWTVVERMENHERVISAEGGWSRCELTPRGVLRAEERGAPPAEEVERHQMARTEILAQLADLYDREGVSAEFHHSEICDATGLGLEIVLLNLSFLTDVGYVVDTSSCSYRITHQGLEAVRKWRQRKALSEELERVETLAPQPRGHALQKLLAKAVEQFGWLQEESVRTSHEEMDVIIYHDREYYLVECKWVAEPVEAAVVRELKGKLDNRVDVRGIVVSMSGFSAGAVEQAADYAGQRVILLFGPEDVRALVSQESTFEELLNEKYRELVTRRQVVWR
jgi:hypothetical protein